MCVTKNVSGQVRVSEWAYLREQCDGEGHCGTEGEMEDDFMTQRGQDQGQEQRGPRRRWCGERGRPSCQLWGAAGRPSGSPAWARGALSPGRSRGMHRHTMSSRGSEGTRFDNHIKVLATSVGVQEKGLLAGFNPLKLGSLTLSPVREGGQQPSICQPPCTGLRGLIFYQKQREKRSSPGHHGEEPSRFTLTLAGKYSRSHFM